MIINGRNSTVDSQNGAGTRYAHHLQVVGLDAEDRVVTNVYASEKHAAVYLNLDPRTAIEFGEAIISQARQATGYDYSPPSRPTRRGGIEIDAGNLLVGATRVLTNEQQTALANACEAILASGLDVKEPVMRALLGAIAPGVDVPTGYAA